MHISSQLVSPLFPYTLHRSSSRKPAMESQGCSERLVAAAGRLVGLWEALHKPGAPWPPAQPGPRECAACGEERTALEGEGDRAGCYLPPPSMAKILNLAQTTGFCLGPELRQHRHTDSSHTQERPRCGAQPAPRTTILGRGSTVPGELLVVCKVAPLWQGRLGTRSLPQANLSLCPCKAGCCQGLCSLIQQR